MILSFDIGKEIIFLKEQYGEDYFLFNSYSSSMLSNNEFPWWYFYLNLATLMGETFCSILAIMSKYLITFQLYRFYRMLVLLSGGRIDGDPFFSVQNFSQGHQRGAKLLRKNSRPLQRRFRWKAGNHSPPVQVVAELRSSGRDRSDFRVHSSDPFARRKQSGSGKRNRTARTCRSLLRGNRKNWNVSRSLPNFFRLWKTFERWLIVKLVCLSLFTDPSIYAGAK